ncbi:MAG: calcium-translocating P-type ATPase, PMCA-type [Eubacterium sp.]|nr:calcium-translocating P-type ATPase, PMCA-type [Eubacterium sp.]
MVHTKSIQTILAQMNLSAETGLDHDQVEASKRLHGINTFYRQKKESMLKRVWDASTEPMLVMLIIAAVITLLVNIYRFTSGGEYNFLECLGIFVAIALSVVITIVTEGKSAKAFEALNRLNEDTLVKVLREGRVQLAPQREIVVGDVLLIETGDKIVADGRLIESNDLSVDESALTGESVPVSKDAAVVCPGETPVAERVNMVYSGCFVSGGNAKVVVTAVGGQTEFGKIATELSSIEKTTTPLQEKLDKLGKFITVLGCSAAAIAFLIQVVQFIQQNSLSVDTVSDAFITSIVLIVAAVPEGLPTIVAVSLALNIIKMTGENALVKKMIACETIGCINIICSDKTGTLTENKMTVQEIYYKGELIKPEELRDKSLIDNYCLNSNANVNIEDGQEKFIGNPTEGALLVAANKAGCDYRKIRKCSKIVHVYPFSSQNKDMSTVVSYEEGLVLYTKGNPEKILTLCKGLAKEELDYINSLMREYQSKGGRILAFAHKPLHSWNHEEQQEIEKELIYDGFVVISDPLSEEVYEAILKCQEAGIDVMMLTGDNILTACAIADELHMLDEQHKAVEASDIEKMSDEELLQELKSIKVIARSTPLVKLRIVKLLKQEGNVVAVTGDGINDAPAIKHADAGISMGIAGTEVTKEASDIVLLDDSFMTIVKAVQWGRGIYENFKRFIMFQLTVNVASVVVVIASILCGFETPFTALDLLWINIIMDGPPALTLGLEPIREDLLKRPPTKRNESIITSKMLRRIFINGLFISAVFMLQHFTNFLGAQPEQEKTVLFTLFVVFQLFNAFNCRELDDACVFKYLFHNKLMLGVFLLVLILQFAITQVGGAVFETVSLDAWMWVKILLTGVTVVILNEIIKIFKKL